MKRSVQSAILAVIGVIAITATVNGLYLNFVKPSLRWWLVLAGVILVALAVVGALQGSDDDEVESHDLEHAADAVRGHEHGSGPRVGWAIVVPFIILSAIVPAPLGSYTASRASGSVASRPAVVASAGDSLDLPVGDPVAMTLGEFSGRALFDETKSLQGRQVQLVGFVTPKNADQPESAWFLTRIALSCCAADGYPIKVALQNAPPQRADAWVTVTGRWVPGNAGADDAPLAILDVESVDLTSQPAQPYE